MRRFEFFFAVSLLPVVLLSIFALALVIVDRGTTAPSPRRGSDPKPPSKPLAHPSHDAAHGPTVPGISADIHFTTT